MYINILVYYVKKYRYKNYKKYFLNLKNQIVKVKFKEFIYIS